MTEEEATWIGEGIARVIDATARATHEAITQAGSNGPILAGAIAGWLEVNGSGSLRDLQRLLP